MKLNVRPSGAAMALALTLLFGVTAEAGAPQQKTQAPGYYRLMLGEIEVTALCDGTFSMDAGKMLTGIAPPQLDAALARSFLKDPVETSVDAFLINTGTKLVLIDTGAGTLFGPTLGNLPASLKASGYQPEQVEEIYITHMHGDHVGGLVKDGKRAFPNAIVRAAQQEADFWLSKAHMDAAPADRKDGYQSAMNMLNPYVSAGKFKPFSGDTELVPGIRAVASPGHTAGHTVYVVESKGQRLVLWGDLMHVAAAQFPDPAVTIRFDTDSAMAAAQRKKVFANAAEHGDWVGGAHLSFPGLGHLSAAGSGYAYVPANYSALH
ncbi:MAG TPA: MBL fold metallo-hydrolase [Steroidobacteraceae bacterium]|jgi:glyoxylase-like metal-dependent hydrolase (beta-lactamase superfamily II)|nr:MBL fold metallo-hydrolase [Steroidobacteraceae bacterium]